MITVRQKIEFRRRPDRTKALRVVTEPTPALPPGRVPRVSRLMALAIHFVHLIRDGKVADLSELARLVHVSQPRATQIANLNHLAPEIQENLLTLPRTVSGRDPITERDVRPIAALVDWSAQRRLWMKLASRASGTAH